MSESGVSATKVIEAVGVLRRLLDRAVRDKAIPSNPCALRSVTLPKRPQVERLVLSPAEVERLAKAMKNERDRVLVRLLAYGGLRVGEAFALRWSDVDLENKTLTVRQSVDDSTGTIIVGPTKTHAVRTITLPDALVLQLGSLAGEGIVFPNRNGDYLRYGNWRRDRWNPAVDRSGVKALPHDLRGTAASLLIDAGASVADVCAHLGHSDVQTTLKWYAPNQARPEPGHRGQARCADRRGQLSKDRMARLALARLSARSTLERLGDPQERVLPGGITASARRAAVGEDPAPSCVLRQPRHTRPQTVHVCPNPTRTTLDDRWTGARRFRRDPVFSGCLLSRLSDRLGSPATHSPWNVGTAHGVLRGSLAAPRRDVASRRASRLVCPTSRKDRGSTSTAPPDHAS